jgi:hypothetical protein
MRDVDAAWLAAAIDGEGSISIKKNKNKTRDIPYIALYNNNKEFIEKGARLMGIRSLSKSKNCFRIYVSNKDDIVRIILSIAPFIIIKRHNARCVLQMIEGEIDSHITPIMENDRPSTSLNAKNYLKGNRGNSEGHRMAAMCARNNHLKGNYGNKEQHRLAGMRKGKEL